MFIFKLENMFTKKSMLLIILIPIAVFIVISLQITHEPEKHNEIVPTTQIINESEGNQIFWKKDRPLTWDDFKAIPDGKPIETAQTNTALTYKSSFQINTLPPCTYQINWAKGIAYVNKSQSWVKEGYGNDPHLLEHEQRHFDMVEIHVREFNKKFANELLNKPFPCPNDSTESLNSSVDKEVNKRLKKIFDDVVTLWLKMNEDYENQTIHGTDYEKQQEWNNKIDKLLE